MAEGPERVNSIVLGTKTMQITAMKRSKLHRTLYAGIFLLMGCAPLTIYHQEGVSVSRMESDLLQCEVSALGAVPVSTQLRRDPPQYIPGRRTCRSDGSCYTRGGYFIQGRVYSVDVNAALRERVEQQCMADAGYRPETIPNCPEHISRAAPEGRTQTLPRLSSNSCAVRNDDGSWQIVTQAK